MHTHTHSQIPCPGYVIKGIKGIMQSTAVRQLVHRGTYRQTDRQTYCMYRQEDRQTNR